MVVDIDDTSGAPKNGGIDAELRYTGQFQSDQEVLCDDCRSRRFWGPRRDVCCVYVWVREEMGRARDS